LTGAGCWGVGGRWGWGVLVRCLEPGKKGLKDLQDPVNPKILPFLVQDKVSILFFQNKAFPSFLVQNKRLKSYI